MLLDLDIVKLMIGAEYKTDFNELTKDIKFIPIISYTTRPKRETETEGVEHYFISNEEADAILANNTALAFSIINGNRYFSLENQLVDQNVYIIDPIGVKSLNPDIKKYIIYVTAEYTKRMNRYINRTPESTEEKFEIRNMAENEQFTEFEKNIGDIPNTHILSNNNPYFVATILNAAKMIIDSYTDDTLYCIVGRTSAGKDIITRNLTKLFEKDDKKE